MAILTLDDAIAGAQLPIHFHKQTGTMEAAGVFHSLFYTAGLPGAASAPTPGVAGEALTSVAGQLAFPDPTGDDEARLLRLEVAAGGSGTLLLCDRLWHNSGIAPATTTAQTIDSVAFPARDRDGLTAGTDVLVGIEVRVATTNAGAVTSTTMSYTNSAGTDTRTATMTSFPATAVAGTFVPFLLADGDQGVRSIQSVTLGTSYAPSGSPAIHLVAYRVLARVGTPLANAGVNLDAITGGFVKLYPDTTPFLIWHAAATTNIVVTGSMTVTHG